jgi:hypothetical protein
MMAASHVCEGTDVPTGPFHDLASEHHLVSEQTTASSSSPAPAKIFNTYRRAAFGRKHIFSETTGPARYWIFNPVPQKHSSQWRPIFWRGDNPKYCPESTRIGKARRTGFWNSFRVHIGDGMEQELKNKERRKAKKGYARKQKWRKWFCMGPSPPKKPLEEEEEVTGLIMPVRMFRPKGLGRTLKWEINGNEYMWKGTRTFLPNGVKKMKGISHDFKVCVLSQVFAWDSL